MDVLGISREAHASISLKLLDDSESCLGGNGRRRQVGRRHRKSESLSLQIKRKLQKERRPKLYEINTSVTQDECEERELMLTVPGFRLFPPPFMSAIFALFGGRGGVVEDLREEQKNSY
jgi:hypothetical protein